MVAVAARAQDVGKATTAGPGADMTVAEVKPGKAKLAVVEHGTLEPSTRNEVLAQAEAPARIISILPEGTKVKKGDLVCELDSAALRDQLWNQKIVAQVAEAAYNNARLTREVAEIAVVEYEQGIYPQDMQTIQGEVKRAELGFKKTEDRLERTRKARQKLNEVLGRKQRVTEPGDIVAEVDLDDRVDAADQAMSRERFALEQAQSKLNLLQNYTKGKTIKELKSEVQKAHYDELAKKQRWDLEKEKAARLERQIRLCKIYAPAEGMIFSSLDEEALTGQRMKVMEIFSTTPMLASFNVPESMVARVKPGAKARVWVDAFPDETYTGVVEQVAPVPSQPIQGKNVYSTKVKLDQSQKALRPGMSAQVAIPFAERDDVIMVPRSAVLHFDFDNKNLVKVKKQEGGFESRDVVTGDLDETVTLIEIRQGLKPGEQVAKNPLELLSDEEQSKRGQRKGVDRRAELRSKSP